VEKTIDAWQVFWSILMALVSYVAIMITFFMKRLGKIETKLDSKVNWEDCKDIRKDCQSDCEKSRADRDRAHHFHGQEGRAGEVIK
jgi:hypothetical protein